MNPFKFGTVVEGPYFTDRVEKLVEIKSIISSANHLVLISPRRYGKSSIINKAVSELKRPVISINLQSISSSDELSKKLIAGVAKNSPFERFKQSLAAFRFVPTLSLNPLNDGVDISFAPAAAPDVILEDAFALLEKVSSGDRRYIVVFDEFQEITEIGRNLDKKLRSILQEMQHVNFVFLGSQESMMAEIFEKKKSPFYHFGELIHLPKLPYDDFLAYITAGLSEVSAADAPSYASAILEFTACHPYYGQQFAFHLWEHIRRNGESPDCLDVVKQQILDARDLDFTRLWDTLPRTDRGTLQQLSAGVNPMRNKDIATSTVFSSLKRLCKKGFVNREAHGYELEDPFFRIWIVRKFLR